MANQFYIDEVWKDMVPLLPSDLYRRAKAKFWVNPIDKKKFSDTSTENDRYFEEDMDHKGRRAGDSKEFFEVLKNFKGKLGDDLYFGGDKFEYADLCLIPFYCWLYSYETFGKFSVEPQCHKLYFLIQEMCTGRDCCQGTS
ncbi:hypothetical protein CUMW_268610, partial [Citrus unshiu]